MQDTQLCLDMKYSCLLAFLFVCSLAYHREILTFKDAVIDDDIVMINSAQSTTLRSFFFLY